MRKAKLYCIGQPLDPENTPLQATIRPPISVFCSPIGGARRDRTDDLMLAKHALSQLSYGPSRSQKLEIRSQNANLLASDFWLLAAGGGWWAWEDLNLRPHAYQARALTN